MASLSWVWNPSLLFYGLSASLAAQQPPPKPVVPKGPATLLEARGAFKTKLSRTVRTDDRLVTPPDDLFTVVRYKTALGEMRAYLGKPPKAGQKHPAMLWITGGFPPGGGGPMLWEDEDPEDDQSAKAFREAGLVMMYPTFRGSFGNPGAQESFFGEVDDVVAALDHLAKVDYVDPRRVYLGGHSTGGTLALLAAAATDRCRAVFAFGPVDNPANYGQEVLTYDAKNGQESRLRSPIHFLDAIRSPTFVVEGTLGGNHARLLAMAKATTNKAVRFLSVDGADHFTLLTPAHRWIAQHLAHLDAGVPVDVDATVLQAQFVKFQVAMREADDFESLATARRKERDFGEPQRAEYYLRARARGPLEAAAKAAASRGFDVPAIATGQDDRGRPYFTLDIGKGIDLKDLAAVFQASREVAELAAEHSVAYDGWDVK